MRALLRKAEINPRHLLLGVIQIAVAVILSLGWQVIPVSKAVQVSAVAVLALVAPELLVGTLPKALENPVTRVFESVIVILCTYLSIFFYLIINHPLFSGLSMRGKTERKTRKFIKFYGKWGETWLKARKELNGPEQRAREQH